jgi:hypothetical protein
VFLDPNTRPGNDKRAATEIFGDRPQTRRRARVLIGVAVATCAGIAIAVAVQTWYLRTQVIDQSAFTQRAVNVADNEGVRSALTAEISDRLATRVPAGLIPAQSIRPLIDRALDSETFDSLLRIGARHFNAALFHNGPATDSLKIQLGALLGDSTIIPAHVLGATTVNLVDTRADSVLTGTNRAADLDRILSIALPLFAVAAIAVAITLTRQIWRPLSATGLAAATAGAATLLLLSNMRTTTIDALRFASGLDRERSHSLAAGIWEGYFGGMHTVALVATIAGAFIGIGLLLRDRQSRGSTHIHAASRL